MKDEKIEKEVEKAAKRFENFDRTMLVSTNSRVVEYQKKIDEINERLKQTLADGDMVGLKQLIIDLEIADPISEQKIGRTCANST